MFGQQFRMKLDKNTNQIQSHMGSYLSILATLIILAYAYRKADVLIARKDVDILSTINDQAFTQHDIFSYENGLNIAVAFTAYDGDPVTLLDPTIGQVVFNHFYWGPQDDGTFGSERIPIKSHTCSRVELGLDQDEEGSRFLPIYETSKQEVEFYHRKFQCVDKEDLFLHGDYNSLTANQFNVQLQRCHDRSDCKSEAEIDAYLRNKYLIFFYNQIRFDSRHYGKASIVPESRLNWVQVNTQVQQTIPFKISSTQLYLQDHTFVNLDDLTELDEASIFKLEL